MKAASGNENYQVIVYQEKYRNELLAVWERSVLATHFFLSERDFAEIKQMLEGLDLSRFNLHCLLNQSGIVTGFIGLADQKIEMLFLDPTVTGNGLGTMVVRFAIDEYQARFVDVNEQNSRAVLFYKKMGFEVFERSEQDSMGKPYPILHMQVKPISA